MTDDAFPTAAGVVRFLGECIASGVAFKATAGLHHPLRAVYPLTYAPDAPRGAMFGFLNILLAVALLREGRGDEAATRALEEGSPEAMRFDANGLEWRGQTLSLQALERARESLMAFGSCSFREPVGDLRAMHLL